MTCRSKSIADLEAHEGDVEVAQFVEGKSRSSLGLHDQRQEPPDTIHVAYILYGHSLLFP